MVGGIDSMFVGRDLVGQRLEPGFVRVAFDVRASVCVGGLWDSRLVDGADVVGFAVVVPGYDFDEIRPDLYSLFGRQSAFALRRREERREGEDRPAATAPTKAHHPSTPTPSHTQVNPYRTTD